MLTASPSTSRAATARRRKWKLSNQFMCPIVKFWLPPEFLEHFPNQCVVLISSSAFKALQHCRIIYVCIYIYTYPYIYIHHIIYIYTHNIWYLCIYIHNIFTYMHTYTHIYIYMKRNRLLNRLYASAPDIRGQCKNGCNSSQHGGFAWVYQVALSSNKSPIQKIFFPWKRDFMGFYGIWMDLGWFWSF